MRFGERLARERWMPWAVHYFNYELLKRKMKAVMAAQEEQDREECKDDFAKALDTEIEKVIAFYREKSNAAKAAATDTQESAQRSMAETTAAGAPAPEEVLDHLDNSLRSLRPIALDIFHLLGYVSLNTAALRKILKKYAKNVEPMKPQPGYLTLRVEHPHEEGWKLLQGTFLKESIGRDLEAMSSHEALNQASEKVRDVYEHVRESRERFLAAHPGLASRAPIAAAAAPKPLPADTKTARTLNRTLSSKSSFKYTPKWTPGLSATDADLDLDLDDLLQQMKFALEMADRNARLIHPIPWQEAQAGIFEPAPDDEDALATPGGLLLNCINSGLYMANYNLVIPTITELCRKIGVPNAMVGIIIGCSDIATIPGTVGYSIWTNHNYKAPLLASAVACLVGNLAYCLSYDLGAVWLLFLARLVTGLGSARTVNRRYIAIFVAYKDRTWASALFVSLSAVGMALGPLLALPLSHFPDLKFAGLTFDHITMGGWLMNIAWLIFILFAYFGFEDPLRKRKERDELREPLLANGAAALDGMEAGMQAPKVPPPPSSLADSDDEAEVEDEGYWARLAHLWSSPLVATACCIFLCYILKVVQQAYIDGLPIFTQMAYGWSNSDVGVMLGVLGLAAPLVNFTVGRLSARLPDRHITLASILVTMVGCFGLMGGPFPMATFFVAGALLYMGTIVLEALSMSLCSKVIDERMAKGLWNAGLLSTQAGTLGRLCGNLLLSLCAKITGAMTEAQIMSLAKLLYGVSGASMILSVAYVLSIYNRLQG
ncbi:SPX domain-containing membrane protein At1g63010 [Coccomyxa sp. Obi]|nr:SPX domain-containing membrane protein At1g63010 [Coccomyxa sp. Obi]